MINRRFMIKMLKAKKMEYEAMKELMPTTVKHLVEETEGEMKGFLKEVVAEYMKESYCACDEEEMKAEKKSKKVKVEF